MRQRLAVCLLVLCTVFALSPAFALADTKPYFKVYDGDVSVGGDFASSGGTCDTSGNYHAPSFNPLTNQYDGGILAWATSARKGASVDFGAFSMGLIEGNSTYSYGFYSDADSTTSTTSVKQLSFSNNNDNTDPSYWAGYFNGDTLQAHCIPDYYDTKQNSPTNLGTAATVDLSSLTTDTQYTVTPSGASVDISPSAVSIANNKRVTLFVNGNVYISHNITYAAGYTATTVPKLAIIAKGNIYVGYGVTSIEGLYIAQPKDDGSAGVFWTCHDGTASDPDGTALQTNCKTQLKVTGAVVAGQLQLVRVKGDLASAPLNEASTSANIAEVFDYVPEIMLGGPFFTSSSSSSTPAIDSLVNLPPVF